MKTTTIIVLAFVAMVLGTFMLAEPTSASPTTSSSKLLVTTGYYNGDYIRSSEVIDLNNPSVTCQQWPDSPIGVHFGVGGYINESVITCGGYSNGATDKCFNMEPSKTTEIPGLKIGSYLSGGGIIQDSLVVSGGYDDDLNRLKRIETLNEQGSTNGPEMPMALSDHCIITLDSNTLLTTGGISNVESSHFRNKKPSWSCWCTSPFSSAHAYRKALRRPLARSVYLNAPPLVLRI